MKIYNFLNSYSNLIYYSKDNKKAIAFGDIRFLEKYKINNPELNYGQIIKKIYDEKTSELFTSMMHVVLGPGNILFLKFELTDNLYLLNKYIPIENQKQILVKKIGNIKVEEVIKMIKDYFGEIATPQFISSILILPNVLKELGIMDDNYTIVIENNGKEEEISLTEISNNINTNLFYKRHERNSVLENLKVKEESKVEYKTNNSKLDYASDSNIKLLKLLSELSINMKDKLLFENLYNNFKSVNKITLNQDTNIDWMIISSYFLLNENKRINLPSTYIEYLKEFNFECYSLNNEEIDYDKIIKYIRNSLAHSSYEIINDRFIRIYSYNEEIDSYDFNIIVAKRMILKLIEDIEFFGSLNTHFPIIGSDFTKPFICEPEGIKNKQELIEYLKSRKIIDLNKHEFKEDFNCEYFSFWIKRNLNNTTGYDYYLGEKEEYDYLKQYLNVDLEEKDLSDTDIDYILEEIEKIGPKFYTHSFVNKNQIIANIYRNKKLGLKVLNNEFLGVIKTENKLDNSLLKTLDVTPIEFYNLQNYLKILVISYLNNLLLYSYNENKNINTSELEFERVMSLDINILKDKKIKYAEQLQNRINNLSNEKENLVKFIDTKEKLVLNTSFLENAPENVIEREKNSLIKAQTKLGNLDETAIEEEVTKLRSEFEEIKQEILRIDNNEFNINEYILEHLRNSLAHGNISFPNGIDVYDISNTKIVFEDFHPKTNNKTFEGEIKVGCLLKQLSNKKYLESIYFDNSHFNKTN